MVRLWCGARSARSVLGAAVDQKRKTQHSMENVEHKILKVQEGKVQDREAEGWNVEGEKRRATRKECKRCRE